ncbi:MAG TPA: hypothetical protein VNT30_09675 [Stellaceae bacterium]|nr:hypothetical protein [Stellaceae bacterium]
MGTPAITVNVDPINLRADAMVALEIVRSLKLLGDGPLGGRNPAVAQPGASAVPTVKPSLKRHGIETSAG